MEHEDEHEAFSSELAVAALERLQRYDPSVSIDAIVDAIDDGSALLLPHKGGFSVLRLEGENLHIWITAMYSGHSENLIQVVTDIVSLGQLLEVEAVTFATTRRGWKRVAKSIGFEEVAPDEYKRFV